MRHHDIGSAEFQGITEYIELRNSKNMLDIGGFLGIAELTNTLEWLHPMALLNSEAILFHPGDFGPGGSHGAKGRDSPADVELIPEPFSCKSNPRPQRLGLNTMQQITNSH